MPKVTYSKKKGLVETKGEGFTVKHELTIDETLSVGKGVTILSGGMDIKDCVTIREPDDRTPNLSGSVLILRGNQEPIFFHMGGNQYISNNAWFDDNTGAWGSWIFASGSGESGAFRWGWVNGTNIRFDLDYADGGTKDAVCTFKTAMTVTASNGYIGFGKTAPDSSAVGSFNARLDVTGSHNAMAIAVTGSVDLGGAAGDARLILPRLNNAQRNGIASPMTGTLVYNSQTNKLNFYNGTVWRALTDEAV